MKEYEFFLQKSESLANINSTCDSIIEFFCRYSTGNYPQEINYQIIQLQRLLEGGQFTTDDILILREQIERRLASITELKEREAREREKREQEAREIEWQARQKIEREAREVIERDAKEREQKASEKRDRELKERERVAKEKRDREEIEKEKERQREIFFEKIRYHLTDFDSWFLVIFGGFFLICIVPFLLNAVLILLGFKGFIGNNGG